MLTSQEIREITFSGAVGGYKKDEVDVFLDNVEADYLRFEKAINDRDAKIKELEEKLSGFSQSQESINNILLSAQRFADQMTNEAKERAAQIVEKAQNEVVEITEKSKAFSNEFETVAKEKKARLEAEISSMLNEAKEKKAYIENATAITVKKQQELFTKLKEEMASFRADVTNKYKEHLKLLSEMQISTELDPEKISKLIEENQIKDTEDKVEKTNSDVEKIENPTQNDAESDTLFDKIHVNEDAFSASDEIESEENQE